MKKLFSFVCLVVLLGISVNVMGQPDINQSTGLNVARTYSVNGTDAEHAAGVHAGNTYTWAVLPWDGTADYSLLSFAPGALTAGTDFTIVEAAPTINLHQAVITWKVGGYYVVEVEEKGAVTLCTTKRRFGVRVVDLDLLVQTYALDNITLLTEDRTEGDCTTASGGVWTSNDNTNLNDSLGVLGDAHLVNPKLGTLTYKYKISLYGKKGSTDANDLIEVTNPNAKWQFTAVDNSDLTAITTPQKSLIWGISTSERAGLTVTSVMGAPIFVPKGRSSIIITAKIKDIAADEAELYKLDFSIAPSTVKIDDRLVASNAYADGTEDSNYDGVLDGASNINKAYKIIVNPIPNTSVITVVP